VVLEILRKYHPQRGCEDHDYADYSWESRKWQIAYGIDILYVACEALVRQRG
jgi:hypothetical protein